MRPLVGISCGLDDRGRWKPGREYQYLESAYVRAVEQAGATPVLLPVQQEPAALIDRLDGLLVPGGDDFEPPVPYPSSVVFDPVPQRQLDFDRSLLLHALESGMPFFGICYGMQLLALVRGGRLHYDLASDLPSARAHRLPEPHGRHPIRVAPGSRLASLIGAAPQPVNSRHHQAVAEPGSALRVCAWSPDDVVEGIEAEGDDFFCLGVQWHPERLDEPHRGALFGAFVEACRGTRRRP